MASLHANSAREALVKMSTLPLLAGENISARFRCRRWRRRWTWWCTSASGPTGVRRVEEVVAGSTTEPNIGPGSPISVLDVAWLLAAVTSLLRWAVKGSATGELAPSPRGVDLCSSMEVQPSAKMMRVTGRAISAGPDRPVQWCLAGQGRPVTGASIWVTSQGAPVGAPVPGRKWCRPSGDAVRLCSVEGVY